MSDMVGLRSQHKQHHQLEINLFWFESRDQLMADKPEKWAVYNFSYCGANKKIFNTGYRPKSKATGRYSQDSFAVVP